MIELLFVAMLQSATGEPQTDANAVNAAVVAEPPSNSVRERRTRNLVRCRDQVVLGSRMGRRVCMSQAEEDAMREETQRIAEEMHHSGPFGEGSTTGRCAEIGRSC